MISQATIDRINRARTIDLERYEEDGADNRFQYLEGLAENLGVPLEPLIELAELLGPNEDFDGLVTMAEDNEDQLREMAS